MKPKAFIPLLLFLLLFAYATSRYLEVTANRFSPEFSALEQGLAAENWTAVRGKVETVEQKWGKIRFWWRILIDHIEIDNIEQSLTRLKEYAAAGDRVESLNELAVLQQFIKHIPEREALSPDNVL